MISSAGCARNKSAETSASPAMDGDGAAGGAVDELAALEQQLALREAQLRATGVGSKAATGADSEPERDANDGIVSTKAEGNHAPSAPARVTEPTPTPGTAGARAPIAEDLPGGRCEQICEIAAAICTLEQQICGLLARHPDDGRYQAACERAAGDCRFATEACHACD
ncbi:MAG: hypothetical protein H0T76_03070 [Nannocystis sp.]|nr:hypothetical protein [Nannocystis sp.]MBA3545443.1 hypothetical protein [Nannocystis sp.]